MDMDDRHCRITEPSVIKMYTVWAFPVQEHFYLEDLFIMIWFCYAFLAYAQT